MPAHLRAAAATSEVSDGEEAINISETRPVKIGPELPAHLAAKLSTSSRSTSSKGAGTSYGDEGDDDSDSDLIGPLPPDHPKALEIASRYDAAREMRNESKSDKKLQREEWMLIPPSNKPVTELGLGPRKFLQRAPEQPVKEGDDAEDSDEEWERQTRLEMDQQIIDEYDNKMDTLKEKVEGSKRKAGSLLAIHQEELKKKKAVSRILLFLHV
jgi:hypothetical protein